MQNAELESTVKNNVILEKSIKFAIRIVKLYQFLQNDKNEYTMSKQLLKCGTSIGANINEAINGQSRKDFLAKMYISFKEATETEYWITLLASTDYLNETQYDSILKDCVEIKKILTTIIRTTKERE